MASRSRISRRLFLGAAGTLLALPSLEAMIPKAYANAPVSPIRFLTFHFPIGAPRAEWAPSGTENSWQLGQTQQAELAAFKNDVLMVTGAKHPNGSNGHTVGAGAFLTCAHIDDSTHTAGTSADQYIADFYAGKTPLRSLELGTEIDNEAPGGESQDLVLKDHLSWNKNTPLPKELSPQKVFDRMFASPGASAGQNAAEAAKRRLYGQSVIDAVRGQAQSLKMRLGAADNVRMDQYLTGVRELELRIAHATGPMCTKPNAPPKAASQKELTEQHLDLMVLAAQCDITRVMTFGYACTVTEQAFPWIGVNTGYHIGVTHCGSPALCDTQGTASNNDYVKVNKWFVSEFAYLLGKLKAVQEPGGTLLDNSIVYFASEMGDGSLHSDGPLPIIIGGHGGGKIRSGRLLDRPGALNGDVLLGLMQAIGLSTGTLGVASHPMSFA